MEPNNCEAESNTHMVPGDRLDVSVVNHEAESESHLVPGDQPEVNVHDCKLQNGGMELSENKEPQSVEKRFMSDECTLVPRYNTELFPKHNCPSTVIW